MREDEARETELLFWMALLETPGIGVVRASRLRAEWPTAAEARHLSADDWRACGLSVKAASALVQTLKDAPHAGLLTHLKENGGSYVLVSDAEYPPLLREISVPPPVLFYRGILPQGDPAIAVVGTRKCTAYGRKVAADISRDVASTGGIVVSGLAYGVDHAAHEGALEVGGKTVAVLGSGIDCVYPAAHARMADRAAAGGGAVISEFLPWAEPLRHHFPRRNRIISGLSQAVIVVEAGQTSGALITAAFALDQNRDVYGVPGSILSQASRGVNELLAAGATPLLSTARVLEALGFDSSAAFARSTADSSTRTAEMSWPGASPDEERLAALIVRELAAVPRTLWGLQEVASMRKYAPDKLAVAVSKLELSGKIRRDEGGRLHVD